MTRHAAARQLPVIDASRLLPRLYIGSAPASANAVHAAGFRTLALCAIEIQPPAQALEGLRVLRCPITDDGSRPMPDEDWIRAVHTAQQVALLVRNDEPVLVTCAQGRNRSGIVCALALHFLYGWRGGECVRYVQMRRKGALGNERFVEKLVRKLG